MLRSQGRLNADRAILAPARASLDSACCFYLAPKISPKQGKYARAAGSRVKVGFRGCLLGYRSGTGAEAETRAEVGSVTASGGGSGAGYTGGICTRGFGSGVSGRVA